MWSLMREQGFSDEALMAKLVELDEADGVADGRRTRQPSVCRKCGSKVAASLSVLRTGSGNRTWALRRSVTY